MLLNEDRQILLSPVGWLSASLISAAQILLREEAGAGAKTGLQDPCLAQSMGFKVVSGDFVQIIHNGFGHWLAISNIGSTSNGGAEIMVYDSLHPSINKKQITAMLKTTENEIWVNIMDMQVKAGTCDCGLFAVATAPIIYKYKNQNKIIPAFLVCVLFGTSIPTSLHNLLRVDILIYICFQVVMDFMKDVGMSTRQFSSACFSRLCSFWHFHPYFITQFI